MSTPTDPATDELSALRARAYGPDADIGDDPAALARLYELENSGRGAALTAAHSDIGAKPGPLGEHASSVEARHEASAGGPEPSSTPDDASRAAAADDPAHSAGEVQPMRAELAPSGTAAVESSVPPDSGGDHAGDGAGPAPALPWWRRRMPLLWAGSVVAAALIGGALALSIHAIGAGQVAVLQADPDAAWPENMFEPRPEGALAFEDFYGLRALYVPQEMMPGNRRTDCLYVASPEPSNFGFYGAACGAGSFPATVAVLVTTDAPEELRDRFEPGTALQFVLDGSQVRVYAAAPAPGSTP